jgi:hypothetical protein
MGIFLLFALVVGALIGSLMAAKKMGAMGGDFAIKTAGNVVGTASFGTTAFVGRRVFGGGSYAAAGALRKTKFARLPFIGRATLDALDKGAKSSYDARAIKVGKQTIGTVGAKQGVDLGGPNKVAKGGYAGIVKKEKEGSDEHIRKLGMTPEEEAEQKALGKDKETAEEVWQKRKEVLQTEIEQLQQESRTANQARQQALAAQKKLVDAALGGQKEIEETKYNRLKLENASAVSGEKAEIIKARDDMRIKENDHKKSLGELDTQIQGLRADVQMAKKMEKSSINWGGVEIHSNKQVAKGILDKLKKTDNQKLLDALSGVQSGLDKPAPAAPAP